MWKRGTDTETNLFGYDTAGAMAWSKSPFFHMIEHGIPALRRRLDGPDAVLDFGVLNDIRGQGNTDYLNAAFHRKLKNII